MDEAIRRHLRYSVGKAWHDATLRDIITALALSVRERAVDAMLETEARYQARDPKRLYYLSIEFLIGRSLASTLWNLGLMAQAQKALANLGVDWREIEDVEDDAALGNGGLGRLAACFLDSLATHGMPGYGYGINYEYGLFRQVIENGYQMEKPDHWMAHGTVWQIERPEEACLVPLYGRIEHGRDRHGQYNPMWMEWKTLIGVPYDMPVAGYGGRAVNYLRLYSARSSQEFDIRIFNAGDYFQAVEQKIASETVSKVLYPSDSVRTGMELRLTQEYFLVACAIRDIVRRYEKRNPSFDSFPDKVAIQMNDTHPALAVAELMRILVDENNLEWDKAWEITEATLGFTNHTLMPEALEKWPVELFERLLPRHLQIIYEINARFLSQVAARFPGDHQRLARMSIIEENQTRLVRMAHLAMAGSHSINGVSAMHGELIKTSLAPDFHELWPHRFNSKTNGVTQRRWLLKANPSLATLITRSIGNVWITDLERLRALDPLAGSAEFQDAFLAAKRANKERLAKLIRESTRHITDPASLFDVHVKRIHAYKRQLLNVLHIIHQYLTLVEDGELPPAPKTYIFAGKAAPGYWLAKQIIKLIHNVAAVVNKDNRTGGLLQVVFIPDYRVSLAEVIIPAADLSEQISTAGTEASGTGNMKFAMNGAVTIGTRDGANLEILAEVGEENFFVFGLTAEEIARQRGSYNPRERIATDSRLRRVLEAIQSNRFSREEPEVFSWLNRLLFEENDHYFHLADLPSYIEAQRRAADVFSDSRAWAAMAIRNVARSGRFSSDRTIREYASGIWNIHPCV
jgi:starch phosphorylase